MKDDMKVEKGIPPPPTMHKHGGMPRKYPFADLKVEESFFVLGSPNAKKNRRIGTLITAAVGNYRKRTKTDAQFTVRKVVELYKGRLQDGYRVWRIEDMPWHISQSLPKRKSKKKTVLEYHQPQPKEKNNE